jgi:hypothetical protein
MNNMYYGFGQPTFAGQTVNVDTKTFCQTLTKEEMDSLRATTEEFTLGITKREELIAVCMHRDQNGKSTLQPDPTTGKVRCLICGEEFNLVDRCSEEDIQDAVNRLLDILQTTKTLYVDMPSDAARNFYKIIALIKKIVGLYKISADNFNKHENAMMNWGYNGGNSMLSDYNTIAFGGPMMMGGYGMPQGNMYWNPAAAMNPNQQPMGQQPMYYNPNVVGAPMQQGNNPFGTNGTPQPAYQPTVNGYAYQPQQGQAQQPAPQQPAQPVADNAKPEATVTSTFQA